MARGFESKDVEFQQAEADRAKVTRRALSREEHESLERRRALEWSLARAESEQAAALLPAHREMLEQAITALRQQLGRE